MQLLHLTKKKIVVAIKTFAEQTDLEPRLKDLQGIILIQYGHGHNATFEQVQKCRIRFEMFTGQLYE